MIRLLKTIHQIAGVIGALLVFGMAVTGILLNHRTLIGFSSSQDMKLQEVVFAIHSGSLNGVSFVWLTDLAAICMIVLSVTGIWIWMKLLLTKRRRRSK